jgi:hypothetical protein
MSEAEREQSVPGENEYPERKSHRPGGWSVWALVGGAALVVMAATVLVNLPDVRRYIKISRM